MRILISLEVRLSKSRGRHGPPTFFARILLILMVIVVLTPYGFLRHHLFKHRLRNAARSRPCPSCGQALGTGALRAADEYWKGRSSDHQDDPVFMVIDRKIYALCAACGSRLDFREESGTFEPIEPSEATE